MSFAIRTTLPALLVLAIAFPLATKATAETLQTLDVYRGIYRVDSDHFVGIDTFTTDDGTPTLLYSDYASGVVRRLFRVSENEFVMGPHFSVQSPAQLEVAFERSANAEVSGITLRPIGAAASEAARVPLEREDVVFESGDATLAGSLVVAEDGRPHPAIVLLHGSGPLTRNSFGPYPLFFASLGFAVLTYDKRGTGQSSGVRADASTGRAMADETYPTGILNDASAAFAFLKRRREIDPTKIGFWGSSEGGMLATQVAARSADVAFAIDSSGFMGPLWQTTLYQSAAYPRRAGAPEADVQEYVAFTQQWLDVARTGTGWDGFVARREEIRRKNENALSWSSGEFASVDEMRWYWDHVLSFSPLPALKNVRAPVLGVFGEADVSTDARVASENLRRALTEAGNHDVTVKIFAAAGHSLSVDSGDRMAPGVFDTLRAWLRARVGVSSRIPSGG